MDHKIKCINRQITCNNIKIKCKTFRKQYSIGEILQNLGIDEWFLKWTQNHYL